MAAYAKAIFSLPVSALCADMEKRTIIANTDKKIWVTCAR
jgi:hypothetical protein